MSKKIQKTGKSYFPLLVQQERYFISQIQNDLKTEISQWILAELELFTKTETNARKQLQLITCLFRIFKLLTGNLQVYGKQKITETFYTSNQIIGKVVTPRQSPFNEIGG